MFVAVILTAALLAGCDENEDAEVGHFQVAINKPPDVLP
jgi:hypothetical protein